LLSASPISSVSSPLLATRRTDEGRREISAHRPWKVQATCSLYGNFADISTLSIEEVMGRLLAFDDYPEPKLNQDFEKLYLTEEQCFERYKSKEQESNHASGASKGRDRHRPPRGKARGVSSLKARMPPTHNSDACRYCDIVGIGLGSTETRSGMNRPKHTLLRKARTRSLLRAALMRAW
jgi:hypothetical protein